jgi:hypothetical protein
MTEPEKSIAWALRNCSFLPGSFDKRFVNQLDKWIDRDMTVKGRAKMMELLQKYRRQIPNFEKLKKLVVL